jgi:hypothetical protein
MMNIPLARSSLSDETRLLKWRYRGRIAAWLLVLGNVASVATGTFTLAADGGLARAGESAVTINAGPDWVPLEVCLDIEPGSALDFSDLVPRHAPAGKFGRVVATRQGKFAFENCATPSRFYGVDLCCSSQYLPHELADRLADRLVRLGYNAVRIHHYERELVERVPGGIRLRPDKLDQFDYLFAAFKQRGIYVTTDLYVSRLVALADVYEGRPDGSQLTAPARSDGWTFENFYNVGPTDFGVQSFKMAVYVNDRAYENYKAFARVLLGHRNPYTKLRYADDPALAWLSLMNEDCPGNFIAGLSGRLREDWQRAWNRWLADRYPDRTALAGALGNLAEGQDPAQGTVPLPGIRGQTPDVVLFNTFLAEVQRRFFERTRTFLRDEMHCRALLSDCNGWTNPVQVQAVRSEFDYVDDHFYVDHPEYLSHLRLPPSRSGNGNPVAGGATGGRACAFTRLFGKPFTITEFNYCGPGQYRGVGGMLTGALASLQDWDGLWRHVYSYNRENITRPAAMYYFDIAADPLTQAAERAGLCLFLRGDLQPAKHSVAITSTPEALLKPAATSCDRTPAWNSLAWLTRVGWAVGDAPQGRECDLPLAFSGTEAKPLAAGAGKTILDAFRQRGWLPPANRTDVNKNRIQSESGEVTIDAPESVLTVDTARTAGGFAPAGKRIETHAATIEVLDTCATVWVSSLDGEPIPRSKRLLITHLTDLQNSGTRYADRGRQLLTAWGQLPHLVRVGRAAVTLHLQRAEGAKVYSLAVDGKRTGEVPARAASGSLSIPLSVSADGKARMLYEIELR